MRHRISVIVRVCPSLGRLVGWLRIRQYREIRHSFDVTHAPHLGGKCRRIVNILDIVPVA